MELETPSPARSVVEAVLLDPDERSKLVRYARVRFGIDPDTAEDLLQETALDLLLGLVAAGAIAAIATPQPTSSFAGGFAAGAGAAFVVSFLSNPRRGEAKEEDRESP